LPFASRSIDFTPSRLLQAPFLIAPRRSLRRCGRSGAPCGIAERLEINSCLRFSRLLIGSLGTLEGGSIRANGLQTCVDTVDSVMKIHAGSGQCVSPGSVILASDVNWHAGYFDLNGFICLSIAGFLPGRGR